MHLWSAKINFFTFSDLFGCWFPNLRSSNVWPDQMSICCQFVRCSIFFILFQQLINIQSECQPQSIKALTPLFRLVFGSKVPPCQCNVLACLMPFDVDTACAGQTIGAFCFDLIGGLPRTSSTSRSPSPTCSGSRPPTARRRCTSALQCSSGATTAAWPPRSTPRFGGRSGPRHSGP